jgi:hypothetical protein
MGKRGEIQQQEEEYDEESLQEEVDKGG